MYFNAGIEADEKHLMEAERLAQRIFELQPESAHGYRLLGVVEVHRGNMSDGIQKLERATQLDSNDADSRWFLVCQYSAQGRVVEARKHAQKLKEIDPLTPLRQLAASGPFYVEGQFIEFTRAAKIAYEAEPENPAFRLLYFYGLAMAGKDDEAFALLDAVSDIPNDFLSQVSYFFKFALQNEKTEALQLATEAFKATASKDWQYSSFLAEGFALLDEKEESLHWLEHAVKPGFINYPFFAKHDPFLENLRGDERYEKLMERVKVEWQKVTGLT